MESLSLLNCNWPMIIAWVSSFVDIEATAREFDAFTRAREVRSAKDLLRLALIYGPGGQSLSGTSVCLAAAALMTMSKTAIRNRLMNAGDWLEYVLSQAFRRKFNLPASPAGEGLDLALVDGTVICQPGSKGSDWRVHARYDPAQGRFTDLVLTTGRVAERAYRTLIHPGQTIIMDRGYARLVDLSSILSQQGHFIVRIGWQSLPLLSEDKQKLDLLSLLPKDDQILDQVVHLNGISQPLRLVIQRLPADKAEIQRKKAVRQSNRRGRTVDPRTIEAAGYLMVLTSHPAQAVSASEICEAYRNRWQVETGIKRTKSLGGLDKLRAKTFALGRAWFLAQLLVAVMTDELANEIAGFAPRPLALSAPNEPSVSLPPQAEPLMEAAQEDVQTVTTSPAQISLVEFVTSEVVLTQVILNDTPLSIGNQDKPTSTAFMADEAHAGDQIKNENPVMIVGSLMQAVQDEAQPVVMKPAAAIPVEAVQSKASTTKISRDDTTLNIKTQDEPASTKVIKSEAQTADQTKSEKPVAIDRNANASAAQKGKRQMSFWRAWSFAHDMLLRAIMPDIVELTQAQLKRVRKALSESPRKRVNRGNALRPALS